jgi:hypothetical protein
MFRQCEIPFKGADPSSWSSCSSSSSSSASSSSSSLGATTSGKFWPSQGILSIWDGF